MENAPQKNTSISTTENTSQESTTVADDYNMIFENCVTFYKLSRENFDTFLEKPLHSFLKNNCLCRYIDIGDRTTTDERCDKREKIISALGSDRLYLSPNKYYNDAFDTMMFVDFNASYNPHITMCPPGACPPDRITPTTCFFEAEVFSPSMKVTSFFPYVLGNIFFIF